MDEPAEVGGRSDEVLAFGQIVCTLTSREDASTVAFLREGRALGVPRADGSLSSRPLTRDGYAPSAATAERAYHREHEDRDINDAARRRRGTGRCKVRENPSTACSGVR